MEEAWQLTAECKAARNRTKALVEAAMSQQDLAEESLFDAEVQLGRLLFSLEHLGYRVPRPPVDRERSQIYISGGQ